MHRSSSDWISLTGFLKKPSSSINLIYIVDDEIDDII